MTPAEQPGLKFPPTRTALTAPDWETKPLEWCIWYLENHPEIYREFKRICDEAVQRNPKITLSARFILHMIRWQTDLKGDGDAFKINDHVSSLFARLYMLERPQYQGKFRNRKSFLDALTKDDEERLLLAFEPVRSNKRRFV